MASKADPMPPTALDAFRRAHELDNKDPRSRYFLAVARDLKGEHQGAIDDWLALLKDTPPGAPWEQDLRRTIEQVGKINNIDVTAKLAAVSALSAHAPMAGGALGAIPGPNSEQIQQAAALTPTQQNDMAHSMVESLEAKLKTNPGNIDGWLMLVRSRVTLQEPAKARAALQAAIAANPGARERLQGEAAALGVTP
jgi:cytochrome c-type biogenesis protein CcmH